MSGVVGKLVAQGTGALLQSRQFLGCLAAGFLRCLELRQTCGDLVKLRLCLRGASASCICLLCSIEVAGELLALCLGPIKRLHRLVVTCVKQLFFGFEGLKDVSGLQRVPLDPIGKEGLGLVAVLHASQGLPGKQLRLMAAVFATFGKVFALFA